MVVAAFVGWLRRKGIFVAASQQKIDCDAVNAAQIGQIFGLRRASLLLASIGLFAQTDPLGNLLMGQALGVSRIEHAARDSIADIRFRFASTEVSARRPLRHGGKCGRVPF